MNRSISILLLINLFFSCQPNSEKSNYYLKNEQLTISYNAEADVVQFKMFEGLSQILIRDTITGNHTGVITIPNLSDAIFTYNIIVHKKDSLNKMAVMEPQIDSLKINQSKPKEKNGRFIWIGNNRIQQHLKNENIIGRLKTKTVKSQYLSEPREITVYSPKIINSETPIIYFTDGSNVNTYAPYLDYLISADKIMPIQLVGIHSSSSNRYEEYIKGDGDNELFSKHEHFIYEDVMKKIEKEIPNWDGQRYIYGVSNGAAFCMYAGINKPKLFEEIIAFSTADYISPIAQMINPIEFEYKKYPKFYMGAGKYETSIFNDNLKFIAQMKDNGLEVNFKEFIAGHDYNTWLYEFVEYVEMRFGE